MSQNDKGHKFPHTTAVDGVRLTKSFGWENKTLEEINDILSTKAEWTRRDRTNLERLADAAEAIAQHLQGDDPEAQARAAREAYWKCWRLWVDGIVFVAGPLPKGIWHELRWAADARREEFVEWNVNYKTQPERYRLLAEHYFRPNWKGRSTKAKWWREVREKLRRAEDE